MTSYSLTVRDKAFDLLKAAVPGYRKYRKARLPTLQPEHLPALSVFILTEDGAAPEAAFNAEPDFDTVATLGISALFGFQADPEKLEQMLDGASEAIKAALLNEPKFISLLQGIPRYARKHFFPQDGETYLAEVRIEIGCAFYETFQPVIPDTLRTIHVETRYPSATTDPDAVQQVIAPIDVPQDS